MTYPSDQRDLRNEWTRLWSELERQQAEYRDTRVSADTVKYRVAAAERNWKRITAEWDEIRKPQNGGTVAEWGRVLSDRERIAYGRRGIYNELATAMTEQVEIDFRIARLENGMNKLAYDLYEIGQRLEEPDDPPG